MHYILPFFFITKKFILFVFEATKIKVTQPINLRPKPFRPNKLLSEKKEKQEKTTVRLLLLQVRGLNQKHLQLRMLHAESTMKFSDMVTKPTKHNQVTEDPTIRLFSEKNSVSYILEKNKVRLGIEPCYLRAERKGVPKLLRFTNKKKFKFYLQMYEKLFTEKVVPDYKKLSLANFSIQTIK